ncbi:hypothetical protein PY092_00920 [Muricauda sp. 334s03]|uniref:Uncharacterized protein n=1 Tax=Flagellimonas yonaguniensis TaxID=3031325 RepID=A0ABT5XU28_9FLAO|nr:hypothetical protein [[Muricauda] yonaguniensis]MDF0714695.1 hypothetical protein [[Muricauda] yonaguniensis]
MWNTTSVENFTPTMKITLDKDMFVGATFVESDLVDNLSVIHDMGQGYFVAVSPVAHVPNLGERVIPHFMVRGTQDPLISNEVVEPFEEDLKTNDKAVEYTQVEGAGYAFFDLILY